MANPGPATTVAAHPSQLGTNQANRLLAVYKGVSTAAAQDFNLPIINSTTYSVQQIVVANANNAGASADVHTVVFGLYTAPSQGGTAIYTAAALTGVTGNTVTDVISPTTTAAQTAQNLYVNISTPFVTATVDVYLFGYDLS